MKPPSDFNVKISIRNGRLLDAIREDYVSVAEMSRKIGVPSSTICAYINMRQTPLNNKTGDWKDSALNIAGGVSKNPSDLWPEHLQTVRLTQSTGEVSLSGDEVKSIRGDADASKLLVHSQVLQNISDRLSSRQRRVLNLRYGYGGQFTLDECAKDMGLSRERIRQIEASAFRKMRRRADIKGLTLNSIRTKGGLFE
tara:strand:- start:353 stop:943 length:591 start_codon:yes stop_codon:yes gene_type:complete